MIATKTENSIPQYIQPPTDKRYELYNFIANHINNWKSQQLVIEGSSYKDLLKNYNEFLANHPGEVTLRSHQRLKQQIERFIAASEKLQEHPEICDLQKQATHELEELPKYLELLSNNTNNNNDLFNIFRKRFNEANTKISGDFNKNLQEFYQNLRVPLERFKLSLNLSEKQEYQDLLKSCNDFLLAPNDKKKYQAFEKLLKFILQNRVSREPVDASLNASNCKWDSVKFVEYPQKISSWSVTSSSRK